MANGPIQEVNGRVEARPTQGVTALYTSQIVYDLTDSSVHVEVVRPATAAGGWLGLQAFIPATSQVDIIRILLSDHELVCSHGNTVLNSTPYDAERHRWWRLRERGGTTFWETSPNGCEWEVLHSAPTPFTVTAVKLGLAAGLNSGGIPRGD